MAYVICDPCIGTKDTKCREVCPVDAMLEKKNQLVIDPDLCVDCGACVQVCPVSAIFHENNVPSAWLSYKNIDEID